MKPSIPKGTRDFSPDEMVKRNYIFDTIKSVYQRYGYMPLETPTMENIETLLGKYGDEGDKLLFRVLDSGDYFKKFLNSKQELILNNFLSQAIYDLTFLYLNKYSDFNDEIKFKDFLYNSVDDLQLFYGGDENVFIEKQYAKKIIKDKRHNLYKPILDLVRKADIRIDNFNIKFKPLYDLHIRDKILNKIKVGELINKYSTDKISKSISEKGLRYDLTVPFARYVVMHQNEITFPFKRYQIQPVWRADRPQKGRYREFYQCDADVIGSTSLLNEVELIQIIDDVFSKFGLKVLIQINNRKILSGIAEYIGETEKIIDITVAIDKLDKIGIEKVNEELRSKGLSEKAIEQLQPIINLSGTTQDKIQQLKTILSNSTIGLKGIEEVEYIFSTLQNCQLQTANCELELTLARGLNYYTGAIIEVKVNDERTDFRSSILGGGRYDDLTGIFGLPNVSGVGISFGADRIYDVMEELKLFPESVAATTKILFVNFGKEEEKHCLQLIRKVREAGINAELYPESAKMKKQMSYADAKKIPFVALIGEEEMKTGMIALKNMTTGEQEKLSIENLIEKLS